MSGSHDFWLSCGHHLLDRDTKCGLPLTDEFLKAYLARPELMPPPDACQAERAMHRRLLNDPRRPATVSEIMAIADTDARENWVSMLAWRDHLVRHATLEAAYLDIVRHGRGFPHLLINQLVQVLLRTALDDCNDAFMVRAAELFFRPQRLALREGSLLAADQETIAESGARAVSPLSSLLGLPSSAELTVLSDDNADAYWQRSDQFDLALDLTEGRRGLASLGQVIERWVFHLLGVSIEVEPVSELREVAFTWYIGLDAEATRMGDLLWHGGTVDDQARSRLAGLYRLTFDNPADMAQTVRGQPTWLMMAMSPDNVLRLKPQNLVVGLPMLCPELVH